MPLLTEMPKRDNLVKIIQNGYWILGTLSPIDQPRGARLVPGVVLICIRTRVWKRTPDIR